MASRPLQVRLKLGNPSIFWVMWNRKHSILSPTYGDLANMASLCPRQAARLLARVWCCVLDHRARYWNLDGRTPNGISNVGE